MINDLGLTIWFKDEGFLVMVYCYNLRFTLSLSHSPFLEECYNS